MTLPTAAVPIRIFSAPAEATLTPPEMAVIVAVPDAPLALNITMTWPLMSVSASAGTIVPSVVVKVTCVPLVRRRARRLDHLRDDVARAVDRQRSGDAVSVIVEPHGARSGTLSHAARARHEQKRQTKASQRCGAVTWYHEYANHLKSHELTRSSRNARPSEAGYAMAALIVGHGHHGRDDDGRHAGLASASQREKEAELIFRGQQIARAIGLFQRKQATRLPPTVDVLVKEKFLRKKYKDPITSEDFDPLGPKPRGRKRPGGAARPRRGVARRPHQRPGAQGGRGANPFSPAGGAPGRDAGGAPADGIIGVTSKSKDTSIRLYNGRTHYNEWPFIYPHRRQQVQQPGAAAPGPGGPRARTDVGPHGPAGRRARRQPRPDAAAGRLPRRTLSARTRPARRAIRCHARPSPGASRGRRGPRRNVKTTGRD